MSIEAFRLQNFMGFEDSGWIELRSITLLFGRNSSGKSAIIRALLLLQQSLKATVESGPLVFVAEDGSDFGGFEELVRDHDLNRRITVGFRHEFQNSPDTNPTEEWRSISNIQQVMTGEEPLTRKISMTFEIGFSYQPEEAKTIVDFLAIRDQDGYQLIQAEFKPNQELKWAWTSDFFDIHVVDKTDTLQPTLWPIVELVTQTTFFPVLRHVQQDFVYSLRDSELKNETDMLKLSDSFEAFRSLLGILFQDIRALLSFGYVGPLRLEPQRFYNLAANASNQYVRGAHTFLKEYVIAQYSVKLQSRFSAIKHWLDKSGLNVEIDVKSIGDKKSLCEVIVKSLGQTTIPSNLREVGFGISQVFPIVVKTLLAPENSIVVIEQPELHLHPAAQAELGELFVIANSFGVKLLIETHSENLLLRFRRRIAETSSGKVTATSAEKPLILSDFQAYFVDRPKQTSTLEEIEFDQWGDYVTRPAGYGDFFGQDFEELRQMKLTRIRGAKQ